MGRICNFSGKPLPEHWSLLGEKIDGEFCEKHPDVNLISNCPICGAPVCCPVCCKEVTEEK